MKTVGNSARSIKRTTGPKEDPIQLPELREEFFAWALLRPSPTNPRKIFDDIEELSENIRRNGLLQPLLVRPLRQGGAEVVAGERRYRAIGLWKQPDFRVRCLVGALNDQQVRQVQIIENLQRRQVTPLEEADGFLALQETGLTGDEIAQRVSKHKAYVYARLKLARLRPEGREAMEGGRINPSVAEILARIPRAQAQDDAIREVLRWGEAANVMRVRQLIEDRFMVRLHRAPFDLDDTLLSVSAGPCTTCANLSANMPELQTQAGKAGTVADLCTDPTCYKEKVDAEWRDRVQLVARKAVEYEILPTAATAELRETGFARDYVIADEKEFRDSKHRTRRQVLGEAAPQIFYGRNHLGDIEAFYQKQAYEAALKQHQPSVFPAERPRDPQEDAKAELLAARRLHIAKLQEQIAKAPSGWAERLALDRRFWLFVVAVIEAIDLDGDARQRLLDQRGIDASDDDDFDQCWRACCGGLDEAGLRSLAIEGLVALLAFHCYAADEATEAALEFASAAMLGSQAGADDESSQALGDRLEEAFDPYGPETRPANVCDEEAFAGCVAVPDASVDVHTAEAPPVASPPPAIPTHGPLSVDEDKAHDAGVGLARGLEQAKKARERQVDLELHLEAKGHWLKLEAPAAKRPAAKKPAAKKPAAKKPAAKKPAAKKPAAKKPAAKKPAAKKPAAKKPANGGR
jgi:ParB/RepB/Spo0J family partition protein